jgi:hypothetical protein
MTLYGIGFKATWGHDMSQPTDLDLAFADLKREIDDQFISDGWITVFRSQISSESFESDGVYCALVKNRVVSDAMKSHEWNLRIGSGRPGFSFGGRQKAVYSRQSDDGYETFIHWRGDFGNEEGYLEISEEFRLYYNLFEHVLSPTDRRYYHFHDSGEKELVASIKKSAVRVQLRYLREYISARKCHFLIFFEGMRFSQKNLNELGLAETNEDAYTPNHSYNHLIRDISKMPIRNDKTQSWLLGKCLIRPIKGFRPSMLGPMSEPHIYESFIIEYDSDGKPKEFTSDEEKLANYFGKNPDAPHFLTPVYFSPDVLKKYYDDPSQYQVHDGLVERKGFWSLRMDNNLVGYVVVFLGDLGKLPHKEQLYWKSHNILPQGDMSSTGFRRAFLGEWADPEKPDLFFKARLADFSKKWRSKYGWDLFLPLSESDSHYLESLHIPTTANNAKEFDEQLLAIVKITIDSLNEKKLAEGFTSLKKGAKSIDKLENFLTSKGYNLSGMILFLRNVQQLRSSTVAHRRSRSENTKLNEYFKFGTKDLQSIFEDIVIKMIWMFNTLERLLINDDPRPPVT